MRLLIFINSMSSGGAERVTSNLANYWAEKGWEITIVTLAPQSDDFYELHPAVRRIALELAGSSWNALIGLFQNVRRVFALRRVLQQIQPDIALGMMATANILLALAAFGIQKTRFIGSERSYPPQHHLGMIWERLRRYTYGGLSSVTALTREGTEWIRDNTRARRVVVIPNSVNWPLTHNLPHKAVEDICKKGRYILLAVGRLSDEKQFTSLINCFQLLAGKHPEWDLIILGEGPLQELLEEQKQNAGLEGRVFLPGRAGNIGDWYERADLYVMTSRFEGFPNTLIEAMAYGVPAVSFDCDTGPREIIRNEVDGLLVPPGDMAAMAAALDRMLGDAALRQRFATNALEVRERFSMERVIGIWEELFAEVHNDGSCNRSCGRKAV